MANFAFVIAIVSMNILLGTLCLAIARGIRESPALQKWGMGMLLYTLGLLLNLWNLSLDENIFAVIGYFLIAWASVFSVRGVLSHTPYHLRQRWTVGPLTIIAALIAYNHYGPKFRPIIDFATPAILAILLFVLGAVLLLTALPKDAHQPARFLALGMLFGASVWAFRLLFLAGFVNRRDDSVETLVLNLISIAHLLATVGCTFALFSIEVRKMESALSKVAFSDALTNLPNRRAALERFQQERARATRHGQSFAMLVIDIDHFKKINDDYGHLAGDAMLKQIASVLESSKRAEDILGRIGGEEFVLLLVDPQVGEASAAAERLRQNVEAMGLSFNGKTHTATVSIGIALYPIDGEDWDSVFAVADQRLYQSKQAGRNRVTGLSITL